MCRGLLALNLGSSFAFLNLFYPTLNPPELTLEQPLRDPRELTLGLQILPAPERGGEHTLHQRAGWRHFLPVEEER